VKLKIDETRCKRKGALLATPDRKDGKERYLSVKEPALPRENIIHKNGWNGQRTSRCPKGPSPIKREKGATKNQNGGNCKHSKGGKKKKVGQNPAMSLDRVRKNRKGTKKFQRSKSSGGGRSQNPILADGKIEDEPEESKQQQSPGQELGWTRNRQVEGEKGKRKWVEKRTTIPNTFLRKVEGCHGKKGGDSMSNEKVNHCTPIQKVFGPKKELGGKKPPPRLLHPFTEGNSRPHFRPTPLKLRDMAGDKKQESFFSKKQIGIDIKLGGKTPPKYFQGEKIKLGGRDQRNQKKKSRKKGW